MDSFLACHNVFLGNKWAASAARGNRKDAVTARGGAATKMLAMKLPEITAFVQTLDTFFSLLLTRYLFFCFCFTSYIPAGAMKQQNNFCAGLRALFYTQFIPNGFSQSRV